MKYTSPEINDQLAAEYVLGTMSARVRRRFEALLKTSPRLRKVVAEWEARLTPMASSVPEVTPPQRVWKSIQKRIYGDRARNQERHSNWLQFEWLQSGLWSNLGFWRAATGFATITMLAVGLFFLTPAEPDPFDATMLVVVMQDMQTQAPALTVSWKPGGDRPRLLRLRVQGHAEMAPDTAWELWMLPAGDRAPISLGLITTHELQTLQVSKSLAQPLDEAWGLGMSVEPAGGSPIGTPTGPMLYAGQCVKA